jgi:hypothetical protein
MSGNEEADVPLTSKAEEKKPRRWFAGLSPMFMVQIVAVNAGLLGTIIYTFGGKGGSWATLSASVMIAAAALVSGGLIGILFGVPRSIAAGPQPAGNPPAGQAAPVGASIGANTNLEQISDWLTKIIVGVTLTQFGTIKRDAGQLFHSLAPAVGGGSGASGFAGSIVIYFVVVGFLIGWLYARLRLNLAMSKADAAMDLTRRADRADRAGDPQTAQVLRDSAQSLTQPISSDETSAASVQTDVSGLMARYEELRATQPSGPRRTVAMEDLVRQARQLARSQMFTALDVKGMFDRGTEGGRLMALALMEGDPGIADLPSVLNGIKTPASPFEQFHALTVANLMVSSLNPAQRDELAAPLKDPAINSTWGSDTSRSSLAKSIVGRLENLHTES